MTLPAGRDGERPASCDFRSPVETSVAMGLFRRSSASAAATPPGRGPTSLGRYELYQCIGSGGTASVYLGRMRGPFGFSKVVAIKRLHEGLVQDREFVAMQVDEARLAGHIRHPNVAAMLDLVEHGSEVFVVLEYVHGESLSRLLREAFRNGQTVPLAVATSIAAGVLRGLHAAHEATFEDGSPLCIVHRDVSPQNILVGVDGLARLLDFGTGKAARRSQETLHDRIKGKIGYMPPEQLHGEPVDRRADLFATGVVLWELVVGRRLFEGDTEPETILKVLRAPVPLPSALRPGVPEMLEAVILRALSRERERRFPTALAMAQALEAAFEAAPPAEVGHWVRSLAARRLGEREKSLCRLAGDPLTAGPTGAARWRRSAALAAVAGIVVAAFSGWALHATSRPTSAVGHGATSRVEPTLETTAAHLPERAAALPEPAAPDAGAPRSSPSPAPRPARAKPRASACSPPFFVTGDGHKHFRPECL